MTMAFFNPGFRATDDDDNPLAGGYLRYYAAGTTTPKPVYADAARSVSLGTQVALNSSGVPVSGSNTPVMIYPGLGDYKIRIYNAANELQFEFDNIPGAVEEAPEATTALPETPVSSVTTSGTHTLADKGKLFNVNPTGGSFARTLPSAVAAGDSFKIGFRHNGSAGQVAIIAPGSQNIRGQRVGKSFALVGMGETIWLVSDGSDWIVDSYAPPFRKATDPYWIVLDRLTAPPVSPNAGDRYIINGTPTGAWNTLGFAEHDIVEADGNGSWIRHAAQPGWQAFDVDEEISLVYRNSQWENFQVDPGESVLKTAVFEHQLSNGTNGGNATANAWTKRTLNTSVQNDIDGCSIASSVITLPPGKYQITFSQFLWTGDIDTGGQTARHDSRIKVTSGTATPTSIKGIAGWSTAESTTGSNSNSFPFNSSGILTVTEEAQIELQYYHQDGGTNGTELGKPSAEPDNGPEIYARVTVTSLTALEGPKGDEGDQGVDGQPGSLQYQFSTATSGDPGSGKFLINNANPVSATALHISEADANSADLSALVSIFDDSTSSKKAVVLATKVGEPANIMVFRITGGGTDQGDYWSFPVEYVAHDGAFGNNNDISFVVIPTGDKGETGDPAVLNPSGAYDGGTEYNLFDVVTDQGSSWIAKTTTTGNAPPTLPTTSNTQWLLLAERGPKGEDGDGIGDMVKSVYDPNSVEADAFDMDNMLEGATNLILTSTERSDIASALQPADIGSTVQAHDDDTLKSDISANLTVGYSATSVDDGTKSSGTFTPSFATGNIRRYINGGAHTLAPPSGEGCMTIQVTNNGSAGNITTSGFTKVTGDTITTTNGHDFYLDIRVINGFSQLHVTALQ